MSASRLNRPLERRDLLLAAPVVVGVVWGVKQLLAPDYDVCPICLGERATSCGAPGCNRGSVPCAGACLKPDTPGWQRMTVANHRPDELWMRFVHDDGSWTAWSQNHIGEVVEKVDGRWVNRGRCPRCRGTAKEPCPACQGRNACPRCRGAGVVRRLLW